MPAILGIEHVQLAMPAGHEAEARVYAGAHPGLLVHGLRALAEPLREPWVDVVEAPTERCFRVYVADPFGNRIELMERAGL